MSKLKDQIVKTHEEHPQWTAYDIAAHLSCSASFVRVVKSEFELKIPRRRKIHRQ